MCFNKSPLGDNLVGHGAKNQTWPIQQNVGVTLTYPASGLGKQVTYVAIQVDQVSSSFIIFFHTLIDVFNISDIQFWSSIRC